MHILVVEDEVALCDTIVRSLKRLAYSVDYCYDGQKALDMLSVESFDLVVLDLNLPNVDGMTVLKTLRQTDIDTKVLILSARCEVADKVLGLDEGANDYLTKPFHLDELSARIRNLTLRKFTQNDIVLKCSNLSFNTKTRKADVNDEELSLTRKETGILEYLMLNQGRPVSQEELIEHVWDSSVDNFSNSIRVHISSLSDKFVEDPHQVVKTGDIVKVKVLEVDVPRKRIALTMRLDESAVKNDGKSDRTLSAKPRSNAPRQDRHPRGNSAMGNAFADALKNWKK